MRLLLASTIVLWILVLYQKLDLCASIGGEGRALLNIKEKVGFDPYGVMKGWNLEDGVDHCSWYGVECSDDGRVVALNLKDCGLEGMLAPELGNLIHMKSLILHNNSFSGIIPEEIGELQKLEMLDLGHNNFSGHLPSELGSILSLRFLIFRSNNLIDPGELDKLNMLELQTDEEQLSSDRKFVKRNGDNATIRKLLQLGNVGKGKVSINKKDQTNTLASPVPAPAPTPEPSLSPIPLKHQLSPASSPFWSPFNLPGDTSAPTPSQNLPSPTPESSPSPIPNHNWYFYPFLNPTRAPLNSPPKNPSPIHNQVKQKYHDWKLYVAVAAGVSILLILTAIYLLCCRDSKVVMVRPWATGLSGQLQKVFVTGVPELKRSELEIACEDFSNIIGSLPDSKLYKGTLSSGVEIAVVSNVITSSKDWSKQYEAQFRKKISTLSKVNHRNFVNLLGYCEEGEPFTRMMVFEYAPNGTLFEHLHIKEAEPLNWPARLRIAMGIAYCLEYMQQLNPPVTIRTLNSSSIYLTDDYAAKISDLGFWSNSKEAESASGISGPLEAPLQISESIIYKFGVILLEMLSGRLSYSEHDGLLEHWALFYLAGKRPLKDMVDPTLKPLRIEDVNALCEVIWSCIDPELKDRPSMTEIVHQLRDITAMAPEGATPKISPLWWAELEILSPEDK